MLTRNTHCVCAAKGGRSAITAVGGEAVVDRAMIKIHIDA
jgi:hypothetical protein